MLPLAPGAGAGLGHGEGPAGAALPPLPRLSGFPSLPRTALHCQADGARCRVSRAVLVSTLCGRRPATGTACCCLGLASVDDCRPCRRRVQRTHQFGQWEPAAKVAVLAAAATAFDCLVMPHWLTGILQCECLMGGTC